MKSQPYLLEVLVTFIIACAVFLPIGGFKLDGYVLEFHQLNTALLLAVVATVLRLGLVAFLTHTKVGGHLYDYIKRGVKANVTVAKADANHMVTKIVVASLIVIGFAFPFLATKYVLVIFMGALIYVLLGLGLNIVVGLAGLLDLGYVAFYAIGAYSLALAAQYAPALGFWSMIPLAAITAALFGCLLGFPVLRMHGDYLAIATLGFGEIIRLILTNWLEVTRGPNGLPAPKPTLFNYFEFTEHARYGGVPIHEWLGVAYNSSYLYMFLFMVLFAIVCACVWVNYRLQHMPVGRAWEALREDEIACRSLGLNHVLIKLSAFAIGASVGGIAGVFFASYQGFINPSSFVFFESALILSIVVLGGLGSIKGVIIAAVVLSTLPEFAREFQDFRVMFFGIAMVGMMMIKPRGFITPVRPHFARKPKTRGSWK